LGGRVRRVKHCVKRRILNANLRYQDRQSLGHRQTALSDTFGELIPMTLIGVVCLAAAGVMFRLRSQ